MIDLWRIPFKCIMDFGYNLRNILKIKVLNMKKIGLNACNQPVFLV